MSSFQRLAPLAVLALAAACTPKVGITPHTPGGAGGKPVMVVPTSPINGSPGDRVELAAWGFTSPAGTRVWFGDTVVDVKVIDGWRVEVVVPPGDGKVDVCIENAAGAWVLLEAFQYPEGGETQHCWPTSALRANVETAKKRIAEVRTAAQRTRVATAR